MQLNDTELRLIEGAIPPQLLPSNALPTQFQIPALDEAIPRRALFLEYVTDYATLARNLIDAGVINPDDLPDTVATPEQIVGHGLGTWFSRRIGGLEHMRFDIELLDAVTANAEMDFHHAEGAPFTGATFAVRGSEADLRFVKDVALSVENVVPGLFLTAFTELLSSSYKTIEFNHPVRILEQETAYSLWGNDLHSVTDEEAREELMERYGEEVDTDYWMPQQVIEAYGNGFCFSLKSKSTLAIPRRQRPRFPTRRLKKLSKHQNKQVAGIAKRLLSLRRAARRVEALNLSLPHVDNRSVRCHWAACVILFDGDDRVRQFMDQEGQYLWENGEGSDLHAIEQLPETAAELKTYFENLDALFDLIAQMDALIPQISYPAFGE